MNLGPNLYSFRSGARIFSVPSPAPVEADASMPEGWKKNPIVLSYINRADGIKLRIMQLKHEKKSFRSSFVVTVSRPVSREYSSYGTRR